MRFLDELDTIGCYTDEHETDWDGDTYITPSIINHDQEDPDGRV